ncbi:MAG: hypothetical protein IKT98_09450 [Selenomonadaceae bacterium]|nr:hypothetical protein [Selenomonadaceae bacterium]
MTSKEIDEIALWTAKSIKETLAKSDRKLDDAGEDIIREYLAKDLRNWQRGEKVTLETSARLVKEILSQRYNETETLNEVLNALKILSSKFPLFVENNQRQRAAEAQRLAASMPAIKV